jgi:hypothetical protein
MEVGEALRRGEAMWEGMEGDAHALREDKGAGRGSGVQAWGWVRRINDVARKLSVNSRRTFFFFSQVSYSSSSFSQYKLKYN